MTRIDQLTFEHPVALFTGDGSGVLLVARDRAFAEGSAWGKVLEQGAGIDSGYVYLVRRYTPRNPRDSAVDLVYSVEGQLDCAQPPDLVNDPTIVFHGEFSEEMDIEKARHDDVAAGIAYRAALDAVTAAQFTLRARMEDRWRVALVQATVAGVTTIELRDDEGELVAVIHTTARRSELERARKEPVSVTGRTLVSRRHGRLRRVPARLRLYPDDPGRLG